MQGFTYKYGDRPLEGYTIQRAAGRGGFGEVYYALSDSGREVALKVVQGFEDIELRGISQCMNLKSPHLVTIFDVKHNDQGKPFVIMEYVNGPSLRELIDESPAGLGAQKSAFFLREMAKGLTYLHDRGIVHRDLKPGNVFYEDGYVKIGDYGLSKAISASKHSGQTITVGTVHYMAPEIGQGRYDRSIDIYALGCMLYEMLTGQTPFLGGSTGEILMKHLVEEPKLEGIEEPFAGVIRKALAKDPKDRFQTVQELVEAVFGATHIQQSVSCFSPDSLTMVAGRVAKKVGVGGPGSSGQVGLDSGPGQSASTEDPGDEIRQRVGQKLGRIGERISEMGDKLGGTAGVVGQRIGEELQRAGRKVEQRALQRAGTKVEQCEDENASPTDAPQASTDVPQASPPLATPAVSVDPKRDPLTKATKAILFTVTAAVVAGGTSLLSSQGWGGGPLVAWSACFLMIVGAADGLILPYYYLSPSLQRETRFVRHLAYGGLACVLGALFGFISLLSANGQVQAIMRERYIAGTLLSIAMCLFLMDWTKLMDPARRERIALGHALKAGLLGFLLCCFFDGNIPFVIGTLAGIALAVQAASPFDPQAVRLSRKPRKYAIDIKIDDQKDKPDRKQQRQEARQQRQEARQERQETRQQQRTEKFNRLVTALDLRAQPRALSPQSRMALIIVSIAMLGAGLAAVLAVMTGSAHRSDIIPFVFLGTTGMLTSFCTLGVACRGRMVNRWSTFVRPLLLMACIAGVLAASLALGGVGGRLDSDEATAALFFIIFPTILMLILAVLPRGLASAGGRAQPAPSRDDHSWPGGYPVLPSDVSPYKRMIALLLTAGWFMGFGGLHRLYVGKIGTGLLWMFTGGGLVIGQIVDAIHIATGQFKDRQGRRLVVWNDYNELGSRWQGRAAGWQTPPPPSAPASPPAPAAADSSDARQPNPPPAPALWHPDPWASQVMMRPNRTNPLLASLSALLMIVSLVTGLIGTLSRPALTVMAAFDKNLPTWYDSVMAGSWQEILNPLQVALSMGFMFLAALLLIVARRWAGGAHMFRAIVGAAGMLGSLHLWREALNVDRINWANKASLAQHGYIQDVLRDILNSAQPKAFIWAGLAMLLAVLILAWPPRRPEQVPAVGKGV